MSKVINMVFAKSRSTGLPRFTYTGQYSFIQDGDGHWRIKFLTSGTLTFSSLGNGADGADLFIVGGGGGSNTYAGGGGGYTVTLSNITLETGTSYSIVVGDGGSGASGYNQAASGESSSAFGNSVSGGSGANSLSGGSGGSGGSGYGRDNPGDADGGSNGGNGQSPDGGNGVGQGSTTREFAENGGDLYSGGGAGLSYDGDDPVTSQGGLGGGGDSGQSGTANTGGGAGNGNHSGGSGIVVIRDHRV